MPQSPRFQSTLSSEPDLSAQIAEKKLKVAEFQKKHAQLDEQRKGWYTTAITDVPALQDLLNYVTGLSKQFNDGARNGVGWIDGNTTQLTPEQRISMLDKASAFDMIVLYVNKYLPESKRV